MLPIVRTFISLPAGVARMPFWRFTVLTTLGCIPWILMLTLIGREVGDNWEQWKDSLHYVDYAVAATIVLGALWLYLRRRRAAARARRPGAGRRCAALTPRRSRSGCCRGRRSWCRSPRPATSPRCRGCCAGRSRSWDGARRKQLEVALHAGAGAGAADRAAPEAACGLGAARAAAVLPPAVVGLALERRIEERLGTPATLAAGLLAGAGALVLADRARGDAPRGATPARATASRSAARRRRR